MSNTDKVFFQAKIDRNLFEEFKHMQEVHGRTTRSIVEEFMRNYLGKWNPQVVNRRMNDAKNEWSPR